tara:strand:- start:900 stop:1082 length:183 start_codon:yes stop_codon:yes gene_type:complete
VTIGSKKKTLNKTFDEEQLENITEEERKHFEDCMEEEQVNFHRMQQEDDEREWAIAQEME